jgi:hypothetical protein
MRRIELQDLLPASAVSDQTRSDLLQQTTTAAAGSEPASASTSAVDTLSGLLQEPMKDVAGQITALTAQVTSLTSTQQTQIGATQDNTQAVSQNTTAKGSSGSSLASTAGSLASNLLGGGLSPIISGLMSLFGGGTQANTATVTPFSLPPAVQYQAGMSASPTGATVQPVDYGQAGQVRTQAASPAQQVNIQVNALDSQSFLDHSEEIAQAVKAALLNSSSLNDVIADL